MPSWHPVHIFGNGVYLLLFCFIFLLSGFWSSWYLSVFFGSPLRLPRQQLNPVSFRSFFQSVSLIVVCESSSSDLIIRFVLFMLTTTEYWRQINSDHWLAVEQRTPQSDFSPCSHRGESCRCYRLGRSLLRFCWNKSVSGGHNGRWQRESLGALPCSRWPRPNQLNTAVTRGFI